MYGCSITYKLDQHWNQGWHMWFCTCGERGTWNGVWWMSGGESRRDRGRDIGIALVDFPRDRERQRLRGRERERCSESGRERGRERG